MDKVLLFAVGINEVIANEKLELLKQAAKSDSIDEKNIVTKTLVTDRRKNECGLVILKEIDNHSKIVKVYISSLKDLSPILDRIDYFMNLFSDMDITVITCEQNV